MSGSAAPLRSGRAHGRTGTRPDGSDAPPRPPESASPLYVVNLDQRITYWGPHAEEQLAPVDAALGRRCYEVLVDANPLNGARCRPNCPVIAMARQGQASPDFSVWATTRDGVQRHLDVSILVEAADTPGDARVIHLVRCPAWQEPPAPHAVPGGTPLTQRQIDVLQLLAEGHGPEAIAETLGIRRITVRNHVQAAMERLGAHSRLEATVMAMRAGLLPGTPPQHGGGTTGGTNTPTPIRPRRRKA